MALLQTEAVVLATRNWGEADKIITFFSGEYGKIKALAFGCRRPKSPLAAALQPFNHLEVQLSEGGKLAAVKQCSLRKSFFSLGENIETVAYAAFVAEFVSEFFPENLPSPEAFDRLLEVLAAFQCRSPRITALAAVLQLMEYTGSQLIFDQCVHCGAELGQQEQNSFSLEEGGALCGKCSAGQKNVLSYSRSLQIFFQQLLALAWQEKPNFKVQAQDLMQAEKILLKYLQHLLGHQLKSLTFIQQIGRI